MTSQKRAVGTFSNYKASELALQELESNGFMMDQVSIIGNDVNSQNEAGVNNRGDQATDQNDLNKVEEKAKQGAVTGGTVGGLAGLLVGLGVLAIPGVGPVMLAGAAATTIATMLSGGAIGTVAGGLTGGLVGLGLSEDRAQHYNDSITNGEYLVIIEGSDSDIAMAESILSKHSICDWYIYDLENESMSTTPTASTVERTTRPFRRD